MSNKLQNLTFMTSTKSIGLIICLSLSAQFIYSQSYKITMGTIGNSITHGSVLSDSATQSYPAQLQYMLKEIYADTCEVTNFGLTTTTMLKKGNVPYWDCPHFSNYLSFAPDICLILLGTNDTKPINWDVYGKEYLGDYLAMIDTIKQVNPNTQFMLGYPPPVFQDRWGIRDSIIVHGIIPAIDSVLSLVDAELVDFYHPMLGMEDLFPDKIHPEEDGCREMAKILMKRMNETDIIHSAQISRMSE